ncbi:hypothetical protein ACF061_08915 [Streptomyces sp. NPDC015220]|uniref:hypothetical protein n=1 Tax=Streptomyces sp. NPDC015220 TaxID=3364947 RepID=UPI0037019F19
MAAPSVVEDIEDTEGVEDEMFGERLTDQVHRPAQVRRRTVVLHQLLPPAPR